MVEYCHHHRIMHQDVCCCEGRKRRPKVVNGTLRFFEWPLKWKKSWAYFCKRKTKNLFCIKMQLALVIFPTLSSSFLASNADFEGFSSRYRRPSIYFQCSQLFLYDYLENCDVKNCQHCPFSRLSILSWKKIILT